MIWTQAAICFVVWVVFGAWLVWRGIPVDRISASIRLPLAATLFVGGAILFGSVLLGLASTLGPTGLPMAAWGAVLFVGLAYTFAQVLAATILIRGTLSSVTTGRSQPSEPSKDAAERHTAGNDSDEAPIS